MQPKVRAVPARQLGRAVGYLDFTSYHAAKRRIKNQPLTWLGHLQHLAQRVEQMAISNPALQAVGCPPLDDLPGLAYAIASRVGNIQVAAFQTAQHSTPLTFCGVRLASSTTAGNRRRASSTAVTPGISSKAGAVDIIFYPWPRH